MLPVLFSIGPISISSFGFLLASGFLLGTFLVWRLSRAWDFDEEKILDLTLLTFFGGLIFSRVYFILEHLDFFLADFSKMILFTKYPGFSFWGAFLGGWLTLFYFTKRFKIDFWQMADIAAVGFLGGLILADLGCFLGGCGVGKVSNFPLSVNMVGYLGKRFPVQALESLIILILLLRIWPKALHFHTAGKIASISLIYLGLVKFLLEFLRLETKSGFVLSLVMVTLGLAIAHKISKRTLKEEIALLKRFSIRMITDGNYREMVLKRLVQSWYNSAKATLYNKKVAATWQTRNLTKFLKRIHVNTHPKNTTNY